MTLVDKAKIPFFALSTRVKNELKSLWFWALMSKPCIINIFGSPLSIYEVKITLLCTGKPIWRILSKKVPKIRNSFFYSFFFKWINHIDLFQTMDKGRQNSCSLWKIFFGPAPYVLSFSKLRKTMEIWKNTRFFMTFLS